jgi:AraC family transcriptional regulator
LAVFLQDSKLSDGGKVDSGGIAGGECMSARVMEGHFEETLAASKLSATRSREWMHRVVTLLEAAVGQLHDHEQAAQGTLLEATSLLRQQIHPPAAVEVPDARGRLLAWQARKVRDYIDGHISGPVLVADLCALVQRSEAHFSRSFKRTFGESPHSFIVRRRVELAAQYMLATTASLSDIALRCGFTDQAHLCKHFRQAVGQTPAAWRRAHGSQDDNGTQRFATDSPNGTPPSRVDTNYGRKSWNSSDPLGSEPRAASSAVRDAIGNSQ